MHKNLLSEGGGTLQPRDDQNTTVAQCYPVVRVD